jgi:hypothetical protein
MCKILCLDSCRTMKRYSRLKLKKNLDTGEEGMKAYLNEKSSKQHDKAGNSRAQSSSVANIGGDDSFVVPTTRLSKPMTRSRTPEPQGSPVAHKKDMKKANSINDLLGEDFDSLGSDPFAQRQPQQPQQAASAKSPTRTGAPTATTAANANQRAAGPAQAAAPQSQRQRPTTPLAPPPAPTPARAPVADEDFVTFDTADDKKPSAGASAASGRAPAGVNRSANSTASSAPPAAAAAAAAASSEPKVPLPSRDELRARREAALEEKVKEALEFKLELDENKKKEEAELEIAKANHEKKLTEWAFNNKEKRNVRNLLSTLHTVLWPGATWKTISLADVIEPKQVKLQYRKAMLVVHPDKTSNQTSEVRFIAKRLFEGINEAYQEFLKKENVD